ncbi:MAG: hypothetical protein QM504_06905 [Pseudomonadota bacterium]
MRNLANYLGISEEQLEELDLKVHEDTGSSGEMVYSFWLELPEDISEEIMTITGWKPGQIISDIPVSVLEGDELLEYTGLDKLLNELFLGDANPFADLENKIEEYRTLVIEHHDTNTDLTLKSVLFGAAIGALEAYLWEIVRWKIDNDSNAANEIIKNCEQYGSVSFTLNEIVSDDFSPKKRLLFALNRLVWHRIEKVAPIFNKGLDVELPSLKFFKDALEIRHHIVHRSGKNTNGELIQLSLEQVEGLFDGVLSFAKKINIQLYKLPVTGFDTNVL